MNPLFLTLLISLTANEIPKELPPIPVEEFPDPESDGVSARLQVAGPERLLPDLKIGTEWHSIGMNTVYVLDRLSEPYEIRWRDPEGEFPVRVTRGFTPMAGTLIVAKWNERPPKMEDANGMANVTPSGPNLQASSTPQPPDLQILGARLEEAKARRDEAQAHITKESTALMGQRSAASRLRTSYEAHVEKITSLERIRTDYVKRLDDVKARLSATNIVLDDSRRDFKDDKKTIETLESRKLRLDEERGKLDGHVLEFSRRLEDVHAARIKAKDELGDAVNAANQTESRLSSAQSAFDRAKADIRNLEAEIRVQGIRAKE